MNNKIAILIPTILKDDILMKVLNSIIDNWSDDFVVIVGDQNLPETYSEEKKIFYKSIYAFAHASMQGDRFKIIQLPFDCGLSFARNELVEKAHEMGIKYCLIGADSIKFTESMRQLGGLTKLLDDWQGSELDLMGFELKDRIGWEANLDLEKSFVLDFIDKTRPAENRYGLLEPINFSGLWTSLQTEEAFGGDILNIYKCDIVRNFFLATTESLLKVKWDDSLKMAEHEDFFWRYKKAGYKVGWTNYCEGEYAPCVDTNYKTLRNKNIRMGKELLKTKWGLSSWVKYIHLERTKIKGK